MVKLSRELNLWQVTVAGVGIILGAGIYALIGVAAAGAGNAIWLAFLISAIVAAFSGLSYAELTSMFKGDAAEYDYIKKAFNKKLAFFVSMMILAAGMVSAATVSLGFAGYFIKIVGISTIVAALGLIVLMTLINFTGIKESAWFNTVSTFIEFGGLILVIYLGVKNWGTVNLMEMPTGLPGVFSTAALVFFAYMGFESIIKLREETKNPEKNIPLALIYSIIITSIVYVLVAISAVSIIPWGELAGSTAPLATVVAHSMGPIAFIIIGIVALFSTANTVLITLVTNSRMIYGMAKQKTLPKALASVHKRTQTPWIAILLFSAVTMLFVFIDDIEFVANLTNLFLFATFAIVNLSMMVLRYKMKNKKRAFRCPVNIGEFNVIAFLGILSSVGMFVLVVLNLLGIQTIF
ncbi:amino acid permease [Candidatus Woesearchaeota archaeon]|nr:amino acid permease [Candidatus Woesearchaeota archaeon]MBT5215573.1 amino acid permease [Candidatus Woesearchaeota archaeon]MBT6402513.1 amino acid permease [Candidatus Woesearchaeota archaeon]